jgi:hypothetical protein
VFLSTLNAWLADLVVERSDANLHVLLKVLEVLAMLKAASWAGLAASGLCVTVKKAAGHRNRDVLNKSAALLKVRQMTRAVGAVLVCLLLMSQTMQCVLMWFPCLLVLPPLCALCLFVWRLRNHAHVSSQFCVQDWEGRDPSKQKVPAAKKPRLSGPSVLNLFQLGPQQHTNQLDRQQQHHAQQQQRQQQQAKQQQAKQGTAVAVAAAAAEGAGVAPEQLDKFMTDAEREALAARQAALQEAEEQVRQQGLTGVFWLAGREMCVHGASAAFACPQHPVCSCLSALHTLQALGPARLLLLAGGLRAGSTAADTCLHVLPGPMQAAAAAAELAALEAAPAASSGRIKLDSFEKYERSSKRHRDGGEHEQEQQRHTQHRHTRQQQKHSSSKPDTAGVDDAAGADVAPEGKERATKQLSDFVKVRRCRL